MDLVSRAHQGQAIFVDWSQAPETLFASAEAQAELEQCVIQLPERLLIL